MPGVSGVTVVTTLVCYLLTAHEATGASGARHSLRPLIGGWEISAKLAQSTRRDREVVSRRHCEEWSDEAIHFSLVALWIASLTLAMTCCLGPAV